MSYFNNVSYVNYRFGNSTDNNLHQDISQYVDLLDTIRDNSAFYMKYTILDGDRPDNLSQKLYGDTKYYWSFYLMNDKLRLQGWPMDGYEVLRTVQEERNNTTLTTREDLTSIFKVGSVVTGNTSGEMGTIIKRRLDLGQIIVEGDHNFLPTETIRTTEDEVINSVTLVGAVEEYDSIRYYEDSENKQIDINPYEEPSALISAVSFYDHYVRQNDDLKDIVVLKPDVINTVYQQHQNAMANF